MTYREPIAPNPEPARIHTLKTWPEPFAAVMRGDKRYEIRAADRDYRVGDVLVLQEWVPARDPNEAPRGEYTGEMTSVRITYMTPPGAWGLPPNLCVMSIESLRASEAMTPSHWHDATPIEVEIVGVENIRTRAVAR